MELKERLATIRKEHGLSQMELAEKLDLSRQAISRWESGASKPSSENLIKLSKIYGVPLDFIISGKTESADIEKAETPEEKQSEGVPPEKTAQIEPDSAEAAPREGNKEDPVIMIKKKVMPWIIAAFTFLVIAVLILTVCLIRADKEENTEISFSDMEKKEVDNSEIIGFDIEWQ